MNKTVFTLFSIILLFSFMPVSIQAFYGASTQNTESIGANAITPEYFVQKHESEPEEAISVLFLYSIPVTDKNNIVVFEEIIKSHWNVAFTSKNFSDVSYAETKQYSHIILLELNANTEAIDFFSYVVRNTDAKTLWIGFDDSSVFKINTTIVESQDMLSVNYKNVNFETDEYLKILGKLPDDFIPLIYYTNTKGSVIPYAGVKNDKDIRILSDLPASYDTNLYSLPFLDVFHYFLGHHLRNESGFSALLRLEDVNVYTYDNGRVLNRVSKYLKANEIPFHIAFIPRYINPGEKIDMVAGDSVRFTYIIKKMISERDGVLVQHGYTHQLGDQISALGYEFWDAQNNQPLKFNSPNEASLYPIEKIQSAQTAMVEAGLPVPDIWETPHYAKSKIDDEAFNFRYPMRYEHISSVGSLPFAAKIDGTVFIPENLGYITDTDQPSDKVERIKQLLTFEDPVVSVFWHPWRNVSELEELIKTIQDYGFTFVSVYDLVENEHELLKIPATGFRVFFTDIILYLVFSLLLLVPLFILATYYLYANI